MASKTPKKPEPVNKHIVCSVCGLEWEKHGSAPTVEKCVELLKAELVAARRHPYWQQTSSAAPFFNIPGSASH